MRWLTLCLLATALASWQQPLPASALTPDELLDQGRLQVAIYPVSTLPPMTALNVTANSYAGVMHIGLVAGRRAMPDLDKLAAEMERAFTDLLALT